MPPLSAAQRGAYVSQATEGLRASTVPMLPLYRPGKGGQQAIAVNVLYAVGFVIQDAEVVFEESRAFLGCAGRVVRIVRAAGAAGRDRVHEG
eukprot:2538118-Pyramimonas_sp.AAC.1